MEWLILPFVLKTQTSNKYEWRVWHWVPISTIVVKRKLQDWSRYPNYAFLTMYSERPRTSGLAQWHNGTNGTSLFSTLSRVEKQPVLRLHWWGPRTQMWGDWNFYLFYLKTDLKKNPGSPPSSIILSVSAMS